MIVLDNKDGNENVKHDVTDDDIVLLCRIKWVKTFGNLNNNNNTFLSCFQVA